jgi:hypothetical protein
MLSKLMTRLWARLNKSEIDKQIVKVSICASEAAGCCSAYCQARVSTHVFCAGGAADISRWWSGA